jgi:hypothetical protein
MDSTRTPSRIPQTGTACLANVEGENILSMVGIRYCNATDTSAGRNEAPSVQGVRIRRLCEATASLGLTTISGWSQAWADPLGDL